MSHPSHSSARVDHCTFNHQGIFFNLQSYSHLYFFFFSLHLTNTQQQQQQHNIHVENNNNNINTNTQRASYTLEAIAEDRGTPPLSRTVEVEIDVVDRSNKPPVWDQRIYGPIYVKENTAVGETVTSVKARSVHLRTNPSRTKTPTRPLASETEKNNWISSLLFLMSVFVCYYFFAPHTKEVCMVKRKSRFFRCGNVAFEARGIFFPGKNEVVPDCQMNCGPIFVGTLLFKF